MSLLAAGRVLIQLTGIRASCSSAGGLCIMMHKASLFIKIPLLP